MMLRCSAEQLARCLTHSPGDALPTQPLSISVVACWHDSTAVFVVTSRACALLTVRDFVCLKAYRRPNLIYAWCVAIGEPSSCWLRYSSS